MLAQASIHDFLSSTIAVARLSQMDDNALCLEDQLMIRAAMILAAESKLFPDREFQTLFGITRTSLREIISVWPNVEMTAVTTQCSVLNSLSHLAGYPHHQSVYVEAALGIDAAGLIALYRRVAPILGKRGDGDHYGAFLV